MIRRKAPKISEDDVVKPMGFDDFEQRLGDLMRGERATMGKSLLDVQRELRIKAAYVAAIENCDPSAFDTPGFIAGYVRSYARYLGLDPEEAFATFCAESGFTTAHGMSEAASGLRRKEVIASPSLGANDPFASSTTPFAPAKDGFFASIEPGAIGSSLVLLGLIAAIGYGGWSVLNEIQRVQFAPVEQSPNVLAELDPVAPSLPSETAQGDVAVAGVFTPPADALDRLYRPQALDVPVLVARDAPISTLDPTMVGSFKPEEPQIDFAAMSADPEPPAPSVPQVVEAAAPGVEMVAVRPAWVRVRAADGSVIFEGIMEPGDTWKVPQTEEAPTLRVGESGAIYFTVNGEHYGPAGPRGVVTSKLALSVDNLTAKYTVAALEDHQELASTVAELQR
ncbi:RodZ domain-containing protein [Thalassovita sp.]|uniref:helix-turn-helix domain-containing protein n=1 Tax=Thalassovita sp. TaxID=1979401 RepID=UPI003B63E9EC